MDDQKAIIKYHERKCELCHKSYLSNYWYQHKKTKRHVSKANSIKVKEELLKENKIVEKVSTTDLFNDIIEKINELKTKLGG